MNGLGSLKTRHIQQKIHMPIAILVTAQYPFGLGTTINDCGVFNITNITSHSQTPIRSDIAEQVICPLIM